MKLLILLFELINLIYFSFILASEEKLSLVDFDQKKTGHSFEIIEDVNHNKLGRFNGHKYYNFELSSLDNKRWGKYDMLEMDVFNPLRTSVLLYFTIQDNKTKDYWTQLNHIQTLNPGWNRLFLDLHQKLGERGSIKVNRNIDYLNLKKMFLVIDPDKKIEMHDKYFMIDNILLKKQDRMIIPKDILAFDFSNIEKESKDFLVVTEKTILKENDKFGFTQVDLYRNEDSRIANSILRSSINVNKATFKVRLPNGYYRYQLIIDQLGYWDIPFFKERIVYVNNRPIFKEMRNSAMDFLKDMLRFERIEPDLSIEPYQLYFNDIFKKIESEVEVRNGELIIRVEGDETGVALNSLIIWNKNNEKDALDFLDKIEKRYVNEFNQGFRKISDYKIPLSIPLVSIVKANGDLNITKPLEKLDNAINLFAADSESDFSYIQIHNQSKYKTVDIQLEDIVGSGVLTKQDLTIDLHRLAPQYISPDLNHETYQVSARIAKKYRGEKLILKNNELIFLVLTAKNNLGKIGKVNFRLKFNFDGKIVNVPGNVRLSSNKLQNINFPVGFMALDPLPYSYFKGEDYEEIRKKFRFKALKEIANAGFTTFSGLPEVKVSVIKNRLSFNFRALEETINEIKRYEHIKTIYSYGGQFPNKLMNMEYLPYNMSEDEYHKEVYGAIERFFSPQKGLEIIHTYSDEAGGYNNKIESDIYKGDMFRKKYPSVQLGGFTRFESKELRRLNNLFDIGFYPYLSLDQASNIKQNGRSFGLYNTSQGSLDDPRFTFGLGLYAARKVGLGAYLEWNSVGFNNYPYLDFDGRESDIVIFYPTVKGDILPSLRFLLSVEGIYVYRKLHSLETFAKENRLKREEKEKVEKFLDKVKKTNYFFSDPNFLSQKNRSFYEFKNELNQLFHEIIVNK